MQENNKRIVKNSIYLYVRVIIAMSINLYSSRLILEYLGVEDFGIYNIVGGIVALMMFLNSSMRGATSRFLTYYLGKKDKEALKSCFGAALIVHIAIAALLMILGETVGLWFVNTQLIIPAQKMAVANWIYQFSLIASCAAIIQVPYNATVISHERMNVFAYLEILHVILKFVILFPLVLFVDRLLVYGLLIMFVEGIVTLMYLIYCRHSFDYTKSKINIDFTYINPLLKFSLLDLYGNGTFAVRQQGTNILINRFFGVAFNAASGIATQVISAITTFVNNILTAFRPQIIKEYACGNYNRMESLMKMECMIVLSLATLIFVPLYINLDFILHLWLKTVPVSTLEFCSVLLISTIFTIINSILITGIHATGNIRNLSVYAGTINLFCLLFTYSFFKTGFEAFYAYVALIISVLLQIVGNSIILQRQIPQLSVLGILYKCLSPIIVLVISVVISHFVIEVSDSKWLRLFLSICITTSCVTSYIVFFIPSIKKRIVEKIRK